MTKYAPALWILGGVLFMLPSILGDGRAGLVPVGIVFIIIGVATRKRMVAATDAENSESI